MSTVLQETDKTQKNTKQKETSSEKIKCIKNKKLSHDRMYHFKRNQKFRKINLPPIPASINILHILTHKSTPYDLTASSSFLIGSSSVQMCDGICVRQNCVMRWNDEKL